MTLGDRLGLANAQEKLLARTLQFVLAGLVLYGLVTLQLDVALNGGLGLAVTLLPAVLRREYEYTMDAGLVLWISIAVFLHAVGTFGIYAEFQWYDEITHTVSATIVAGFGYASFRAFEEHSDDLDVPPIFRSVYIVVFVLASAVVWEVLEFGTGTLAGVFGVPAPLVVYGLDDVVTDMLFNVVGAVLVAVWGTGYVDGLVSLFRGLIDRENDV